MMKTLMDPLIFLKKNMRNRKGVHFMFVKNDLDNIYKRGAFFVFCIW